MDTYQEITNLLGDAVQSFYRDGLDLNDVIVLATQGWLEHDAENVIDAGLARILARISAERLKSDLETRSAKPVRPRRLRKPRKALLSPLSPPSSNGPEEGAT
jgi:hypothetical protein